MSSSAAPTATASRLRLSLRAKLYAGFLFFALAGLAVGAVLVDRNVRAGARAELEDRLTYETTMLGQMTANALFGEIDPTDTTLNGAVQALGRSVNTELALIAKNGAVVADSESDAPLSLPPQLDAPEVRRARAVGAGTAVRDGRIFVAMAIRRDGEELGFARSSVSLQTVEKQVRAVRRRMAYGALVAIVAAVVLGYAASSRIVNPMRALFAAARRVGAGDLAQAIPVTSGDEIAELSRAFNGMIDGLRETVGRLDRRNRDMRLVLDNVGQGLLTVDRSGIISAERSAVLERWFGPVAPEATFWDHVARFDQPAAGMFQCAWEELLDGSMPAEVVLDQFPRRMIAGGREYELEYTPLGDWARGEGRGMLIVITDVTTRIAALRAEREQRDIVSVFERIMTDSRSFLVFFAEAERLVAQLANDDRPPLPVVRRLLHTLKGSSSMFGLTRVASLCHALEERISAAADDLSRADREELAAAWAQIAARVRAVLDRRERPGLRVDADEYEGLLRAAAEGLPRAELVRRLGDWRLERADTQLGYFASQARELAVRLGKGEVDVVVEADGVRLSQHALAPFWSTFAHVVRNAVDHGIERPDDRARAGKPGRPRLILAARQAAGEVSIEVTDDGPGIDWSAVAVKARSLRLPCQAHADLVDALFRDGVSTKGDVTELSGRGVGLGAARAACERLGGRVTVTSGPRGGAVFRFTFPADSVTSVDPAREGHVEGNVALS